MGSMFSNLELGFHSRSFLAKPHALFCWLFYRHLNWCLAGGWPDRHHRHVLPLTFSVDPTGER